MYLPYFGQDLESKKKVFGILAHVWSTVKLNAQKGQTKLGMNSITE